VSESNITVTPGAGGPSIDLEIVDNNNARQVVCIGDPVIGSKVAPVDASNGLSVSLTNPTVTVVENKVASRTVKSVTGTLVTTTTTADQVVATYTVTSGVNFYPVSVSIVARLTAVSATASIMGTISLELPSGTKVSIFTWTNPTTSLVQPIVLALNGEVFLAGGSVIRIVCTPAATTSMTWIGNVLGYEK